MNILILSCGTRVKLVEYFMQRENGFNNVVVTDCSRYAPALYVADKYYIAPRMTEPNYIGFLLDICDTEHINVILPLQEDELLLIAKERKKFEKRGCLVAISDYEHLRLCKDKYKMYEFLTSQGIPTVHTELAEKYIEIPEKVDDIFVKPRDGAGSIGAMHIKSKKLLQALIAASEEKLIVQPYINGMEYGVDVYVDFISGKIMGLFCKKKLRMRAGETEKSISCKIPEIKELIIKTVEVLQLRGPIDIDVLEKDKKYYILEINPRFGGGYPHAYECGVNFPQMIALNAQNVSNMDINYDYKEDIIALKYSDVEIVKKNE